MIVITRHSDTIKLLKEKGIITDNDIILDHIDNIYQIEGQVVLGTLPIDLAAYCKKILFIKWNIPLEARGREWTYEETKEYYRGISEYKVISLDVGKMAEPTDNTKIEELDIDFGNEIITCNHFQILATNKLNEVIRYINKGAEE